MMAFYVFLNTMMTLFPLKLYVTSCCHLCDDAFTLLRDASITDHLSFVEIAESEELLSIYGLRIPVLQRTDNLSELDWPFTKNDVIAFLSA